MTTQKFTITTNTTTKEIILTKWILSLTDIINHEISFELFMLHLSKEFSMELLLSYIEFMQFKQLIFQSFENQITDLINQNNMFKNDNHQNHDEKNDVLFQHHISFSVFNKFKDFLRSLKHVPLSSIVFDKEVIE